MNSMALDTKVAGVAQAAQKWMKGLFGDVRLEYFTTEVQRPPRGRDTSR
jgi:hypothetical protein